MSAPRLALRVGGTSDAKAMHTLIAANVAAGHLLPRSLDEVRRHAARFLVAVQGRKVVGCAELAPLSPRLAEVRSLAVHESARHRRIGTHLVGELRRRAQAAGYQQLCVMTHAPEYFANLGFSIVPHLWVQEKVFTDCVMCDRFRRCGQFAMIVSLDRHVDAVVPVADPRSTTIALQVA
ncbi:MAG: GNAT family N-acetyltransferase [Vicinamibacterales bacterium]